MNKIQEEHHNEENSISDFSKDHLDITLKYMKGFGDYLMEYYWKTKEGLYAKIGDDFPLVDILDIPKYTTKQIIEEYIKTL